MVINTDTPTALISSNQKEMFKLWLSGNGGGYQIATADIFMELLWSLWKWHIDHPFGDRMDGDASSASGRAGGGRFWGLS